MIGKLTLGTSKNSGIPVIIQESGGPELYVEKIVDNNGYLKPGGTSVIDIPSTVNTIAQGGLTYAYCKAGSGLTGEVSDFSHIITIKNAGCDNAFRECTSLTGSPNFSSLTTIEGYGCRSMFYGCTGLTGKVDLSSLTSLSEYSLSYMFYGCTGITEVDLSSLTVINNTSCCYQAFYNCTSLETVDLSALITISANASAAQMFYGCSSLKNINLSALTTISANCNHMFYNCTSLEEIDLSSLKVLTEAPYMFQNCTSLTSVDLSSLEGLVSGGTNNGTYYMFSGCTNLVDVKLDSLTSLSLNGDQFIGGFSETGITTNPFKNLTVLPGANQLFANSSIVNGTFPKLSYIVGSTSVNFNNMFYNCHNLKELNFPAVRRMFYAGTISSTFVYNCDNSDFTEINFPTLTVVDNSAPFDNNCFSTNGNNSLTIHFRKDMQTAISSKTNYATLWGAGAIVFDLIGTITVNGETYEREGSCNKDGYYAWHKNTSSITAANGKTYMRSNKSVGYFTTTNPSLSKYYGVMFFWDCSADSTRIRLPSLEPAVHDMVFTNTTEQVPTLEITDVSNNIFVYTVDDAEPEVGDTVYSNTSGTVLGTISAVA